VIAAELPAIERIETAEVTGTFSRCSVSMLAAVGLISNLTYPVAGLLGIVVFLILPPGPMLMVFACGLGVLLAGWGGSQMFLSPRYRRAMESERRLSIGLGHMVAGFKEIKLAPNKGLALQEMELAPCIAEAIAARASTGSLRAFNETITTAIPMVLMGLTGLLAPALSPDLAEVGAIAATVIMMLPTGIMVQVGDLARLNASYDELDDLEQRLASDGHGADAVAPDAVAVTSFERMEFQGVTFSYRDAEGAVGFRVGPMSFTIPGNQITFVIGGNGSGKSTLLRLATGFYPPDRGQILLNGAAVDLRACRALFSAIFIDFHLFDTLYGHLTVDEDRVNELLRRFGIADVTSFRDGRFTNLDLSTGQKKRLAMVVCLLDDKPVLVLDEWAADQDPEFRAMYYRELLPELRAAGKTIIAVSHDDRYFDVADCIVKLEYGKVVDA
jgi:putative ATP-binding cassette transporter